MKFLSRFYIGYALILTIVAFVFSCHPYKKISQSTNSFYENSEVRKSFGKFCVYVEDDEKLVQLSAPSISEKGIDGHIALTITNKSEIEAIKNPGPGKEKKKHKYDLIVHSRKVVSENITVSAEAEVVPVENEVLVPREAIENIELNVVDDEKIGVTVLVLILGVFLAALLTFGIVVMVNGSTQSSNNGSNSNSGSGSGASQNGSQASGNGSQASGNASQGSSGNGSSGGGGSGSCYVATMVYGSYEAPEVLVLRRFRDQILERYVFGRWFIRNYYLYSPIFVERYQNKTSVHILIRMLLNQFVKFLKSTMKL